MNDDVLISVENVSKKFCRDLRKSLRYGVQDILHDVTGRPALAELRPDEFWAVDDVAFKLRRGESLGLIGRNGAGKTTLLRILNGLIKPDKGKVLIAGKVGALIALGAGFNPVLTGRENIYVNAAVLGIPGKEIKSSIDEIIDFAELREFIDMPVQSYSSGMQVRLGFAIATAMNPDILLLDEVLAVGDAGFRAKCYHRIGEVLKKCAVVYVSHDMNQVGRICSSVIILDNGKMDFIGSPVEGITKYICMSHDFDYQSGGLEVFQEDIKIENILLEPTPIKSDERVTVLISYTSDKCFEIGCICCNFKTQDGILAADYNSEAAGRKFSIEVGTHDLRIELGPLPFCTGKYVFSIAVFDITKKQALFHAYDYLRLEVAGKLVSTAIVEMGLDR